MTEENLQSYGRRGQNVRLASKLTTEIDILTDKEDSERRQEFKDRTETLIKNLEVDET